LPEPARQFGGWLYAGVAWPRMQGLETATKNSCRSPNQVWPLAACLPGSNPSTSY